MKVRGGQFSGAIGNQVYVHTRQGQIVRGRPGRPPVATAERTRVQANFGIVSGAWRTLSDQRREAWKAAAAKLGISAYVFFCKINATLVAYGQPRVMDPPKLENLRENPVKELVIHNRRGAITLRLKVPRPTAALTFVFGVRCCSRGLSVPRCNPVLLGRLPTAVRGWSDITDLYVRKFGQPRVGMRVFISTRQVINGQKDDLKQTHADVPPPAKPR